MGPLKYIFFFLKKDSSIYTTPMKEHKWSSLESPPTPKKGLLLRYHVVFVVSVLSI